VSSAGGVVVRCATGVQSSAALPKSGMTTTRADQVVGLAVVCGGVTAGGRHRLSLEWLLRREGRRAVNSCDSHSVTAMLSRSMLLMAGRSSPGLTLSLTG
jgi:hypothetical protein